MRNKIIDELAYAWRSAENHYLETNDDSQKWKVKEKQDKLNLTEEELEELHSICASMGV